MRVSIVVLSLLLYFHSSLPYWEEIYAWIRLTFLQLFFRSSQCIFVEVALICSCVNVNHPSKNKSEYCFQQCSYTYKYVQMQKIMLKTGIMMVQLDVWLEIQYKTSRFAGFHTIRTRNKWNDAHYNHSKNGTIIKMNSIAISNLLIRFAKQKKSNYDI